MAREALEEQSFSPSMQPAMIQQQPAAAASLADIATLLREERAHAESRMQASEAKLEQQRQAMEAKLEAKDAEMARKMAPPGDAIAAEQLAALQTRLEGLHAAQLLADEVRAGPP